MNEQDRDSSTNPGKDAAAPSSPTPSPASGGRGRSRRRWWLIGGIGAAIATVAACSGGAHRWHSHGWGGHGHHAAMSVEEVQSRVERAVDRVLSHVDATDEQKAKVTGIAKAAIADLAPMRAAHREGRDKAVSLLSAQTIDRAAIESLRAGEFARLDQASRRVSRALADIAEVLTPEQRRQLAEKARSRFGPRAG
ncbi:MAG: Spy/CpxP family protein refolding chaperone [Burkholderiaceae bacterium]|nr:Spy/CpxP family protein refolding chaperone [Burkholderiaceae bacterium]